MDDQSLRRHTSCRKKWSKIYDDVTQLKKILRLQWCSKLHSASQLQRKSKKRKNLWTRISTNKFPKAFLEWPTKNTPKQVTHTHLGFATILLFLFTFSKKAKGTARWKRARCVVSWPWTCTTSPGLKETAKLLCAPPPGDGCKMVMGGCIVSSVTLVFEPKKKGFFKTKTKEGTHINKLNKKGRNFQSSWRWDFCFVPRKQWQKIYQGDGQRGIKCHAMSAWFRGSFQLSIERGSWKTRGWHDFWVLLL